MRVDVDVQKLRRGQGAMWLGRANRDTGGGEEMRDAIRLVGRDHHICREQMTMC